MIVICQICRTDIAETSPERLGLPLIGNMFWPHRTGFPPPFLANDWEDLKCRYCGKRPFIDRDKIYTHEGMYLVADKCLEKDLIVPALPEEEATTESVIEPEVNPITTGEPVAPERPLEVAESREAAIKRLQSEGKNNKEIAKTIGVSPGRVSQIIKHMEE